MGRKLRVIIYDDDPNIRLLIEQFLKRREYEVFTYQDPSLCPLQHSHDCKCGEIELCADIMITDIEMPNVLGIDFINSQKSKGCKIKNIATISGSWSDVNMKRAKDLGCAVFEKPFALSALADWIDKCAERIDHDKKLSNWFLQEKYNVSNSDEQSSGDDSPKAKPHV